MLAPNAGVGAAITPARSRCHARGDGFLTLTPDDASVQPTDTRLLINHSRQPCRRLGTRTLQSGDTGFGHRTVILHRRAGDPDGADDRAILGLEG